MTIPYIYTINRDDLYNIYYNNDLSNKDRLKILGIKSNTTLTRFIRKHNIPVKQKYGNVKYIANHNFFSEWSHDMAYCLGFITADGHVWKDRPFITIGIALSDKQILEFIRDCISPKSKCREDKKRNHIQLCVHSKQIWSDLQKYNVNHEKTFNMNINFDIPEEYWGDYLRGYFDGDGSIFSTKMYKKQYYYSSFSSASKDILVYIQKRLNMGVIRCFRKKYYELKICQSECLKLFNILYKNSDGFKLERKYNKFKEININYRFWTKEESDILKNNIDLSLDELKNLLPYRKISAIKYKIIKVKRLKNV